MANRDTSNDVNMTSEELRAWMRKNNFKSQELAEYLGMTNQGVTYWIEGKREIPEPIGRLFNFLDQRPHLLREF
jgi:DNA-binding transcriptional regulator YiaG